ncbi:MAG: hypothetical protein HQ515_18125, partial [Phycisphaeraceae bacterium]|nr:hypothetical protein [Phycisphaeraceae bacterium]
MSSFRCVRLVGFAMTVMFCASMAAADLDGHLFHVRIAARSSYLSEVPVLVRVEILDKAGRVERGLWDAVAT